MGFAAVRLLHPMACPSTNSEVQDLFAKLLEKRFDRQPCCAGILYECMRFLTGHYKVNAAEEFLSFGCFRTEHRLVSAYINRIINVAWCFGHGILLDPEAGILCPFQPVLQGGNCEITLRRAVVPQRPADQRLSRSTVAAGDATICTSTSESVTGNEQLCPRQTNAAPSVVA